MVGVDRTPVSLLSPMKQKEYIAVGRMVENRKNRCKSGSGTNKTCVLLQHLERLCSANSGFTCAAQTILEPRCWLSALPQKDPQKE